MNGAFGNEDDGWEWNAFERVEDVFLTNNPSEGANNRLRKRARTDHPGFYRFCDLMKEESENVKNKCQQFEQGLLMPPKPTSRASKVKQSRIQLKQMGTGATGAVSLVQTVFSEVVLNILINSGALESVTDGDQVEQPVRGRGGRGGCMGRAGGARGRGAAPTHTGLKHFFV